MQMNDTSISFSANDIYRRKQHPTAPTFALFFIILNTFRINLVFQCYRYVDEGCYEYVVMIM